MSTLRTRVTINLTRHETLSYELEGELDESTAIEVIAQEAPDPTWSKIRSEDVDVVELQVVTVAVCKFCHEDKPVEAWHQDAPVCEGCWDERLRATA